MKYLVFDTETTGLINKTNLSIENVHLCPYILQLSYIIFDSQIKEITFTYNSIIKIDNPSLITPDNTAIHKITPSISINSKTTIIQALNMLLTSICHVDIIIGHNIMFDINMIKAEILRLKENSIQNFIINAAIAKLNNNKYLFCTMKENIERCAIKRTNRYGEYNKYPSLYELHLHLFEQSPLNLHNALNDALITLRCYVFTELSYDIINISTLKPFYKDLLPPLH
jgi:DNA polymerase-3 subunit alpha